MVITRESDYALRLLRAMADGEMHNVAEMCESEQIPQQFAYKIAKKLQTAGLITSTRGKNGGCRLAADLHEATLYDVLKACDNDCYLNLCLTPGYECPWEAAHPEACNVHRKLASLQTSVDSALQNLDLYSVMFVNE